MRERERDRPSSLQKVVKYMNNKRYWFWHRQTIFDMLSMWYEIGNEYEPEQINITIFDHAKFQSAARQ